MGPYNKHFIRLQLSDHILTRRTRLRLSLYQIWINTFLSSFHILWNFIYWYFFEECSDQYMTAKPYWPEVKYPSRSWNYLPQRKQTCLPTTWVSASEVLFYQNGEQIEQNNTYAFSISWGTKVIKNKRKPFLSRAITLPVRFRSCRLPSSLSPAPLSTMSSLFTSSVPWGFQVRLLLVMSLRSFLSAFPRYRHFDSLVQVLSLFILFFQAVGIW